MIAQSYGKLSHTMLIFREAKSQDLKPLLQMLSDDQLGSQREDISEPLNSAYSSAFEHIQSDPNNELIVLEKDGELAGMLQLTFIPYLSHQGSWRCLIEAVRVQRQFRSQGLGSALIQWAIQRASEKGCRMVQLTSNKQRSEAIRFYQRLGFSASHEGFKLTLPSSSEVQST